MGAGVSERVTDIPPDRADDGDRVRDVLAGDRAAFDELVRRYQRQATALAWRLLGNADDANEVAQESFLRAYRKLASLTEPERFGPWFLRIVSNQALNFRRGRSLRKMVPLEAHGEDDDEGHGVMNRADPNADAPGEVVSAEELQRRIAGALDRLPHKQRQALVLFSIEKMPQKEVAQVLGISVEAVKWHVFTARKKLKEMLGEYL